MPRNRTSRPQVTHVPRFTLGWELEATAHASRTPDGVILERDGSVSGVGAEYKIAPEYVDRPSENLERLRQLAADPDLHVDRSCGFHVHVGIADGQRVAEREKKQWAGMMVALARNVETFAFSAVPESRRSNHFCAPWTPNTQPVTEFRYGASKYSNSPMRYHWVNVVEMFRPGGIKTVEIRLLGSTKRYAYLLGWIGACHHLAHAAWRLINDPSGIARETTALQAKFQAVRMHLLATRDNETAYSTAVELVRQVGLVNEGVYDRLVSLANEADVERVNARRIADEDRAHELAINQERDAVYEQDAHGLALAENLERAHSEALAMNAPRARRRARRAPDVPANVVLSGFNPDAFEIVSTGGH